METCNSCCQAEAQTSRPAVIYQPRAPTSEHGDTVDISHQNQHLVDNESNPTTMLMFMLDYMQWIKTLDIVRIVSDCRIVTGVLRECGGGAEVWVGRGRLLVPVEAVARGLDDALVEHVAQDVECLERKLRGASG